MSANALIKADGKKYGGKYVATRSIRDRRVVSSGDDPSKVLSEAKAKGAGDPVIIYVPKRGMTYLF